LKTPHFTRLAVALALCLAGAAVSGLLLLQHHGEGRAVAAVDQACGDSQEGPSGCETVAQSSWSSIAGFPLASLGLIFYLALALLLALTLLVSGDQRTTLAGFVALALALGLLVDLLLLGVQAFALGTFCLLCVLTYALSAGALFALLPAWRGALAPGAALGHVEGRLALAGWALGAVAVGAAVLGLEATLDHREAGRQLALLGSPAPASGPGKESEATASSSEAPAPAPPSPTTTPARAEPGDSEHWKQRAEELQQTLDDPQKLEQYFSNKALREYDSTAAEPIDLENVPVKGPPEAPVKVVEYSDFLCPFCRNLAVGLSQFVPQAGGRVAVYFKNYPLDQDCNESLSRSTHPGACDLARGAICAHNQGKFEAYHDRVFSAEGLRDPGVAEVVRLAEEAGLNPAAMQGCLEDPATEDTLAAQIAEARRLDIRGTPALYVNGKKLPRIKDLVPVVDSEARKKGFPPLKP